MTDPEPLPILDELEIDSDLHIYRFRGQVVLGVTDVLSKGGYINFDGVPSVALSRARDRGSAVHAACEYDDDGTLDETSVSPFVLPYLESYRAFKRETGYRPIHSERKVLCASSGVAGTFDRLGELNGRLGLGELKTSKPQPWHRLQTAGYKMAIEESFSGCVDIPRFGIYLQSDGRYRLVPHDDGVDGLMDRHYFQAAVEHVRGLSIYS